MGNTNAHIESSLPNFLYNSFDILGEQEDMDLQAPIDVDQRLKDTVKNGTEWMKNKFINSTINEPTKCHVGCPIISAKCGTQPINLFLDTGSSVTLVKANAINKLPACKKYRSCDAVPTLLSVSGDELNTEGLIYILIKYAKDVEKWTPCIIVSDGAYFAGDVLLGLDTQRNTGMHINFEENLLTFPSGKSLSINYFVETLGRKVNTTTTKLRAVSSQEIPPLSISSISCKSRNSVGTFLFEPLDRFNLYFRPGIVTLEDGSCHILAVNTTNEPVILDDNAVLGNAEVMEVTGDSKDAPHEEGHRTNDSQGFVSCINTDDDVSKELVCPDIYRNSVLKLLHKYRAAVALDGEPLGRATNIEMHIKLDNDAKPIALCPYRIPHSQQSILDSEIKHLLRHDIISPTNSPWAAPVILVSRPGSTKVRLVVDYRLLNKNIVSDVYPLPNISEIISGLGNSKFFSSLDLLSAYHQVPLDNESKPITAFKTSYGHYEYNVVPFGLKTAPSFFQRLMNTLFGFETGKGAGEIPISAYLDDILIHTPTVESQLNHLEYVLSKFLEANLKLKLSKCKFFQSSLYFLGHEVSAKGYSPQTEKVKAIQQYPVPQNVDAVRSFMGMVGYYRQYIKGFSLIAEPLTSLTKKDKPFEWGPEQSKAFNVLSNALISSPILTYPIFSEPFVLETDASNIGIGCVLSQKRDNKFLPLTYSSRLLRKAERNYSTTDKEALAIVWGLIKHRYLIYGYKIEVYTDHKPLVGLFQRTLPTGRLGRWALLVQDFGISVKYRPGCLNNVPDALSRYPQEDSTNVCESDVFTITTCGNLSLPKLSSIQPIWNLNDLIQNQTEDPIFGPIYHAINTNTKLDDQYQYNISQFHLRNKVLHRETIISIGSRTGQTLVQVVIPEVMIPQILFIGHDSYIAAHGGVERTMRYIQAEYFVHKLRNHVELYIKTCIKCAQHRVQGRKRAPIFQYPVPLEPFYQIHMDILGPFTISYCGNKYIICFVDRLTRYTILVPLPDKTAVSVATAFHNRVISEYTTPKVLLSDNAKEFLGELMTELCRLYQIKQTHIVTVHPSANGLCERQNRKILESLRMVVSQSQKDWDKYLPYTQAAINTAYQHAIGDTSHYLLFHRDKVLPYDLLLAKSEEPNYGHINEYIEESLLRSKIAVESARRCLEDTQSKFTAKRNKDSKSYEITAGNRVYVKTRVPPGIGKKLYPKYKGPYRVLEDKGRGRYLLKNLSTDVNKEITLHEDQIKLVHEQCVPRDLVPKVRKPYPHLLVGRDCEQMTSPKIVRDENIDDIYNYLMIVTDPLPDVHTGTEANETAIDMEVRERKFSRPHTRSRGPVPDLTSVYQKK